MIRRNTWILLGIFVLLALTAIVLQRSGNLEQRAEPTPTTQPLLFDDDLADIDQAVIEDLQGNRAVLELDQENQWVLAQPQVEMTDPSLIARAGNQLTSIRILNVLDSPPSIEVLGIDQPAYTMTVTFKDGTKTSVGIGNLTPTGSGFYVRKSGRSVMVAAKSNLQTLIQLLEESVKATEEVEPEPTLSG
jgi:hypothetical protein